MTAWGSSATPAGTDEQLASAVVDGDNAAFHVLAQRYTRPAFNYAYHLLGGYDEASDAMQETLIQVYQSLPSIRLDLPFRPWFYHILRNKCLDSLRRRKHEIRFPIAEDAEGVTDQTVDDQFVDQDPLPEQLCERRDLQQLLHAAIVALPPKYREVVAMRYTSELSFDEIAISLKLPVNTVKTHFQRAKPLLRQALRRREEVHA
jgi:RNA polymerase sigma-70 factor (ECF subfamily)